MPLGFTHTKTRWRTLLHCCLESSQQGLTPSVSSSQPSSYILTGLSPGTKLCPNQMPLNKKTPLELESGCLPAHNLRTNGFQALKCLAGVRLRHAQTIARPHSLGRAPSISAGGTFQRCFFLQSTARILHWGRKEVN